MLCKVSVEREATFVEVLTLKRSQISNQTNYHISKRDSDQTEINDISRNCILKSLEGALSAIGTVDVVILNDDLIKTTILSDTSTDISATATEKRRKE